MQNRSVDIDIEMKEEKKPESNDYSAPLPEAPTLPLGSGPVPSLQDIAAEQLAENERHFAGQEIPLPVPFPKIPQLLFFKHRDARQAKLQVLMDAIVVHADPLVVKEILDKDPTLLFETGSATARSGMSVKDRTPYQAVLCLHDDEMATMIRDTYLEWFPDNEAQKQYDAQFPEGFEKALQDAKARWQPVVDKASTLMKKLADAHTKEKKVRQNEEKTQSAVTEARGIPYRLTIHDEEIADCVDDFIGTRRLIATTPITTGLYYSPDAFITIGKEYNNKLDDMGSSKGTNGPKANLAWRYIIGGMKYEFPVNIAQACFRGFQLEAEKKLRGELQHPGLSFDNLVSHSKDVFWRGKRQLWAMFWLNFALHETVTKAFPITWQLRIGRWLTGGGFSNFISIKNRCIAQLGHRQHANSEKESRCLMM